MTGPIDTRREIKPTQITAVNTEKERNLEDEIIDNLLGKTERRTNGKEYDGLEPDTINNKNSKLKILKSSKQKSNTEIPNPDNMNMINDKNQGQKQYLTEMNIFGNMRAEKYYRAEGNPTTPSTNNTHNNNNM